MARGLTAVLDVGKTTSKLSLWNADGRCLTQVTRANATAAQALDVAGIETWLGEALSALRSFGPIEAIVPVGHGAAAAVIRDGQLCTAPVDYERPIAPAVASDYDAQRDAFADTGSPRLPDGLNLGAQLHALEHDDPQLLRGAARILPWPQFWAWRLCGEAASEVSSLGCHSDLWQPANQRWSALAERRGWAARFTPLRHAGDVLGTLSSDWCARTGLAPTTRVHCGLHDSNAALLAASGLAGNDGEELTVVSTGTWFIAMRRPARDTDLRIEHLPEDRDCLVNVDVEGRAVPSARFMGGRELLLLEASDSDGPGVDTAALQRDFAALAEQPLMVLPGLVAGVGPYGHRRGGWTQAPHTSALRRAGAGLYAAMMTNTMLELIGSRGRVLIEGRFAAHTAFTHALATLRPDLEILAGEVAEGVALGALRLVHPGLRLATMPQRVLPLELDLRAYHEVWLAALDS